MSGLIVMGTLDYSLDNIVEVLDAVASDRCWREGQPRVTFRSIVLLAQCCFAGGGSSYVAAPGLLVHVRSGQGHGYFLAGGQGFYDAFGPVWCSPECLNAVAGLCSWCRPQSSWPCCKIPCWPWWKRLLCLVKLELAKVGSSVCQVHGREA